MLLTTGASAFIASLLWLINIFDAIIVAFEPVKGACKKEAKILYKQDKEQKEPD